MATVRSEIIKQLKSAYPNFLIKDIEKLTTIILNEIKNALKRDERVELRNTFGVFYTRKQKKSLRRNPKTGERIIIPERKTINWKMSKDIFNKLNNE